MVAREGTLDGWRTTVLKLYSPEGSGVSKSMTLVCELFL